MTVGLYTYCQLIRANLYCVGGTRVGWETVNALASILSGLAACIGVPIALIGLFYAVRQLRAGQKIAKGDFLLRLDDAFQRHQEVHTRLRPGGMWADEVHGPTTQAEWIMVEQYMGLFERIKVMVDDGIIDVDTVDRLYGYRLFNIVGNPIIRREKLELEAANWGDFIGLWQALEARRAATARKF